MFAGFSKIAPRRGWRAFTGEVGIIVLGVLIAVGIGKVVEAIDWRDKVATAKSSLNDDLRENAFFLISERREVSPCLRRQLDRLEAALIDKATSAGERIKLQSGLLLKAVYVHPTRPWDSLEWTSVVADNVPAHMARQDRIFYREFYQALGLMGSLDAVSAQEVADLDLMSRPIALDLRTRTELLRIIIRERQRVDLMDGFAAYALQRSREQGLHFNLTPDDVALMNTRRWCRQNGLL